MSTRTDRPGVLSQLRTLLARETRLLANDRAQLAWLICLPLLIGAVLRVALPSARDASLLTFLAIVASIWMVMSRAAGMIVGERAILTRETHAGLRLSAYIAAKAVVILVLALGMATLLLLVTALLPLDHRGLPTVHDRVIAAVRSPRLLLAMVLSGFAGGSLGLLVSALAPSRAVAHLAVPLLVLPQLVFSGPVAASDDWHNHSSTFYCEEFVWTAKANDCEQPSAAARLSYLCISRWADMAVYRRSESGTMIAPQHWLLQLAAHGGFPLLVVLVALEIGRHR